MTSDTLWSTYAIVGIAWGVYAVKRQVETHGWSLWLVPLVAVINAIAWPIAMGVALKRGVL